VPVLFSNKNSVLLAFFTTHQDYIDTTSLRSREGMAQEEMNVQHKPKHKLDFFLSFISNNNNNPRNEMRFIGIKKYR
jgi:hypothetical protein